MARAFPVGRLFGIRLEVHASWFIAYAFVIVAIAGASPFGVSVGPVASYAMAAVAGFALFLSVVVHEFGHALCARRFHVATRSIALFVYGGVATLEAEPPSPGADALVALAGPLVSAVLAALAFGATHLAGRLVPGQAGDLAVALLAYVTVANAALCAFNLIPAYPMDGGRVLRAALWRIRGDRDGATATAALVGIAFAAVFAVAGLVAIAVTRSWTFGWYVVVASFLARACWAQYRALRPRRLAVTIAPAGEPAR